MQVCEGVEWLHIFWRHASSNLTGGPYYEVKDPPCNGWQLAFVLRGEKRSTIFCPYSLKAFQVSNAAPELTTAKEPEQFRERTMVDIIHKHWRECQELGWNKDYDTAAMLLKRLGAEVPVQTLKGGGEDTRTKGGKPAADRLLKPVQRKGKRGRFLAWFLEEDEPRSVREAMAEFGMTRSNALSYLYMLNKDHGLGYTLVGDHTTIILPEGCIDPFVEQEVKEEEEDLDDWLK